MSVEFSVPLSQIAEALNLTEVYVAENYKETNISTVEINRPGLELTGYLEFFDNKRIQVLGNTEFSYLGRYGPEAQKMVIDSIFSFGPPAVIICRDIEPSNAILESAKLHKVSIFSTPQSTSDLTASLVQYLNKELAPRITRHGVLVEVYGEGCLLTGDSGVGKSETAIELIKRGHRLVADDAVEIRRTAQTTLYGQSPENIRHFIELRGIGIINARKLFGMGAIKLQEKIDMVINLEQWDSAKVYDRMGNVVSPSNYTVSYKNNTKPGYLTLTVKFKGNYSGTAIIKLTIKPKKETLSSLKSTKKKKMTVKWKKDKTVTGYQIQYSTSKKYAKKSTKTVTISKKSTTSKTISKLKSKKKYYVRIRAYKKSSGKKIYGAWSKTKTVKVK